MTSLPGTPPTTGNLHRELAPVTPAAWAEIEEEARRTFRRTVAGRRVVDMPDPGGAGLAAVGTGHLTDLEAPVHGVRARLREARRLVELRVPFTVDRSAVDDVERGARDSDWQPVKDAARTLALAEDRTVFDGYDAAGVRGLRAASSNPAVALPAEPRDYPDAVSRALTALRLAGVDGPYALLLGADEYRAVSETSDHGYPIAAHLGRMLDGPPIWAPAVRGGFVLSTRGGDFALHLGQDVSIGYTRHDADTVELYLQETLTFFTYTDEAVVVLEA
ncbi:family 1 encapsulin nanocompartment shell protein [Streptomyces sp. NPDC085529]|uniref:family 1 encapsulin nanocompartment shell protein n=1 Tax=Streptomyces sp. NPDC085529 TaxID=3365729 RepID=UPI0037D1EB64